MGKHYRHVTIEERCEIARLRSEGRSVRQIATGLDRSPSTVARELKRNMSQSRGYQPVYADQQARARRWRGCRLERDDALRAKVLSGLKQGWSPDQVSGRLELEAGRTVISHESIYRFVYAQIARRKDYSWRHYLPRAKSKRGWRGRKGGSAAFHRSAAPHCRASAGRRRPPHSGSLGSRPDVVQYRHAVLIMHERHSRILIAVRPPGKASSPIASAMSQVLEQLPPQWRRTVFDNGTEFARHHQLHALASRPSSAIPTRWQKGGVENAIGRLRRTLPRKTDLAALRKSVYTADSGLQQYAAQVPGLQDPGRDIPEPSVALEM